MCFGIKPFTARRVRFHHTKNMFGSLGSSGIMECMQSGPIPQPWAILHNSDYIHVQTFCGIEFNQVSSRDATHQIPTSRLRCLKCNIAWLVAQSTELRFQHQTCTAVSLALMKTTNASRAVIIGERATQ